VAANADDLASACGPGGACAIVAAAVAPASSGDAATDRARLNWRRAKKAALKHMALRHLGAVRKLESLQGILRMLRTSPAAGPALPLGAGAGEPRQPVLLLLGGGMAAGKSTVREMLRERGFWNKASPLPSCCRQRAALPADSPPPELLRFLPLCTPSKP
jgi:hypothetical protein